VNIPLQVPATLAEDPVMGGPVTEFEPWQPREAKTIARRRAGIRARFLSFGRIEDSLFAVKYPPLSG
jgi:hypothetical protein